MTAAVLAQDSAGRFDDVEAFLARFVGFLSDHARVANVLWIGARAGHSAFLAACSSDDTQRSVWRPCISSLTSTERRLRAQIAAETSWANTVDRPARTSAARSGLDAKFLTEAGGDEVRAAHLRKAHYARMAVLSSQARRRRSGGDPS